MGKSTKIKNNPLATDKMELTIINKNPMVDSRIIAEGIDVDHKTTINLIKKYKNKLERWGVIVFENAKPTTRSQGGRPEKYVFLNESQTIFLLTLSRNTEIVVRFKSNLTDLFQKYRDQLMRLARHTQRKGEIAYQIARTEGRLVRHEETDVIKDLVEYATAQGSTHAVRYYTTITTMVNKHLFYLELAIKPDNIRELLSTMQLIQLSVADNLVAKALREGMDKGMFYTDIYKMAKERVIAFSKAIGRTAILPAESTLQEQQKQITGGGGK